MLVKFTVEIDGREVGTVNRELSLSASEVEEDLRQTVQGVGRMVLERSFLQIADQTRGPKCCGHSMSNRGMRPLTIQTTFGEIVSQRRRYFCADCGQHHVSRPLAQRICQLATVEHFTRLPNLLDAQSWRHFEP